MENRADQPTSAFHAAPDGVRLAVRLTPRGTRDAVLGVVMGADGRAAPHVRVAAPPVEGAANRALVGVIAGVLGVAKGAVTIEAGETARLKRLHVAGDPARLLAALAGLVPP